MSTVSDTLRAHCQYTGKVISEFLTSIVLFSFVDLYLSPHLEASCRVSLKMKGYDFSLSVVPVDDSEEEPLPPHLRLAQEEVKGTSECAKATISKGTALQEMIGWLLRSKDQMAEQVKGAAATYQEEGRLNENLEENLKEVRRAKELSLGYKQQAGEVLTEAAKIAGAL